MKKTFLLLIIAIFSGFMLFAQSKKSNIEVLYFKANLCACKARVCTVVGNDIKTIIEKCYPDSSVRFREVMLSDEKNKEIVTKYNAQSQSLIVVNKKKKKENFIDVSDIVKEYSQKQDKEALEQELKSKIVELKKIK